MDYSKVYTYSKYTAKNSKKVKSLKAIVDKKGLRGKLAVLELADMIDTVMKLENHGIIVEFPSPDRLIITGWPYLRKELRLEGATAGEMSNLIKLVRYSVQNGISIYSDKRLVSGLLKKPVKFLVVDSNTKVITVNGGINFYLNSIDPWIIIETFYLQIHDFGVINGMTVIDGGAAFGDSALYFASKGAKVYAVEPVNYDALLKNLKLNPNLSKSIVPVRAAIGREGKLQFSFVENVVDGGATAFINHTGNAKVEVDGYTFASLLSMLKLKKVDIAKFDCKGCEHLLTQHDLSRVGRYIKVEYHAQSREQLDSLINTIERSGFECSIYLHNPGYPGSLVEHATIFGSR